MGQKSSFGSGALRASRRLRSKMPRIATTVAVLALQLFVVRYDTAPPTSKTTSTRMSSLPKETLWVWQRPADLRAINPKTTAIGYLDQTVRVGTSVESVPRAETFSYPSGTILFPVVRVEVLGGANLGPAAQQEVANLILGSAAHPDIAALQVDFDATRSQREFYRVILSSLRRKLPANLPLSITALVSWCSYDDWISALPVDESVPMFFRMGSDKRRNPAELQIVEPLCQDSLGVSTHERWPDGIRGKRIYVFADRGWSEDLALFTDRKLP